MMIALPQHSRAYVTDIAERSDRTAIDLASSSLSAPDNCAGPKIQGEYCARILNDIASDVT